MILWPGPDVWKRLAVSAGAIALWRIAIHLPVPGVDLQALSDFTPLGVGLRELRRLSLLALGLAPYISASVAVELLALFLKPLKSWRAGGQAGRLRLRRAAHSLTLVFALGQGYSIAGTLENVIAPDGGQVMVFQGLPAKVLVALTMAGGTFFLLALARLISRKGIGHGVSLLIFCGLAWRVSNGIFTAVRGVTAPDAMALIGDFSRFGAVMTFLGTLALLLALISLLAAVQEASLKVGVRLPEGGRTSLPLRLMPAGIVPAHWTGSLLMIPFTVMMYSGRQLPEGLMDSLLPGGVLHGIAELIVIVLLSLFFASLFHRAPRMVEELEKRGGRFETPGGESPVEYLDRRLLFLALGGGLFLGLLVFAGNAAYRLSGYTVGAVSLLVLVAIALDLYGEGRLRLSHGPLVGVADLHDVNFATLLQDILRRRGIPCVLRGGHHRGLLYFFGPFVEMSLMVPETHGAKAVAALGSALES